MDLSLLLNVIFAWASVVLAFLATVIWLLRVLIKKRIISPRSFLGRAHRSLRLSHIGIGIAFVITGILHAVFSSEALFSVNYGTLVIIFAILLAVMYLIKKKVQRHAWLIVHRLFTIMLIILLGIHIYDIGGAPATTHLIRSFSEETSTDETSEQLLALASEISDESGVTTYTDGVYTGVADGFGDDLTVEVTIEDGLITDIGIVSHNEVGYKFYGPAMETIPDEIIESQSVEVDSVSGSTYTSEGIKNAVAAALLQASGDSELLTVATAETEDDSLAILAEEVTDEWAEDTGEITYIDGVYTGVADGYGDDLTVEVTIEGGVITEIEIVSHNERGENFYGPAMETVPEEIIESQSIEVDSVSGSTYTSIGIKNAVADALSQAVSNGELPETEGLPSGGGGHGGGNRNGH